MTTLATAARMKELDRIAIEERGVPSLDLMENAASAVADAVSSLLGPPAKKASGNQSGRKGSTRSSHTAVISVVRTSDRAVPENPDPNGERAAVEEILARRASDPNPRIAVFCGPGNNGGDGLAAARLLMEQGYTVRTFFLGNRERMTRDSAEMAARLEAAGGVLEPFHVNAEAPSLEDRLLLTWFATADCIVDALFGIGLSRPAEGDFRTAIILMNSKPCPVIACDIPSGIHTDSGEVLGTAVRAWKTVTFSCPKPGLYLGAGAEYAGIVEVCEIGIPEDLIYQQVESAPDRICTADNDFTLPRRPREAHKGDFGRVFILAGSVGFTGAPALATGAAVRTGAGLVFLTVPEDIYPIAAMKCTEAMPSPIPAVYEDLLAAASRCDTALIGPGLGSDPRMMETVCRLIADLDIPLVLDADGINAITRYGQAPGMHSDLLCSRTAPTILTPHEGEFARLTGCSLPVRDRLGAARGFASENHCVMVLKGHRTITASPDGAAWINPSGNPGMAKGGSGDILAGMIAALLAQKPVRAMAADPARVAAAAVYWHGCAGDLAALELGEYGMTPSDLLERIPLILKEHTES